MRILFIDDERRRMQVFVQELTDCGHEVVFAESSSHALALVRTVAEAFDAAVLDVSMPADEEFGFEDTNGGTRTGLPMYRKLREMRPNLKVVVLTNVSDPRVAEFFEGQSPEVCKFLRKPDVLPFQFVEELVQFVGGVNDQDMEL